MMMRYVIAPVLLFLSCAAQTYGQAGYGAEAGAGLSNIKFAPPTYPTLYTSASTKSIFSWKAGVLIDVPMNRHTYFQAGINVSAKGAERYYSFFKNDSNNESVNERFYVHYAELPLTVVYKTGMQGKGRFIAGLGATPSYIVGGHSTSHIHYVVNGSVTDTSGSEKIIPGKRLSGFDIGVTVSAGYEMPSGLFFRAYYTAGVNDIGTGSEIVKNRVFGISAGYFIGKGRNIDKEADDLIDRSTD